LSAAVVLPCAVAPDDLPAVVAPRARGRLRTVPEDFRVDELLDVPLAGGGEHLYVHVAKRDMTTAALARALAAHHGVAAAAVGWAGQKDRRAVTTQWLSVHVPATSSPLPFREPGTRVLAQRRQRARLRPGTHAGNRFRIVVRDIDVPAAFADACARVAAAGRVPNYFGGQRFGSAAGNLVLLRDWLAGRAPRDAYRRGMVLSAARAALFNGVLAERVRAGDWDRAIDGDALADGAACGPLWGRGRPAASGPSLARALAALAGSERVLEFLEHRGLRQDLRPLALRVADFACGTIEPAPAGAVATLSFTLPPGGYATSVLRELCGAAAPGVAGPRVAPIAREAGAFGDDDDPGHEEADA
jgi:tRNA pseudouridine13 synthase